VSQIDSLDESVRQRVTGTPASTKRREGHSASLADLLTQIIHKHTESGQSGGFCVHLRGDFVYTSGGSGGFMGDTKVEYVQVPYSK